MHAVLSTCQLCSSSPGSVYLTPVSIMVLRLARRFLPPAARGNPLPLAAAAPADAPGDASLPVYVAALLSPEPAAVPSLFIILTAPRTAAIALRPLFLPFRFLSNSFALSLMLPALDTPYSAWLPPTLPLSLLPPSEDAWRVSPALPDGLASACTAVDTAACPACPAPPDPPLKGRLERTFSLSWTGSPPCVPCVPCYSLLGPAPALSSSSSFSCRCCKRSPTDRMLRLAMDASDLLLSMGASMPPFLFPFPLLAKAPITPPTPTPSPNYRAPSPLSAIAPVATCRSSRCDECPKSTPRPSDLRRVMVAEDLPSDCTLPPPPPAPMPLLPAGPSAVPS